MDLPFVIRSCRVSFGFEIDISFRSVESFLGCESGVSGQFEDIEGDSCSCSCSYF